jgi:benzoate-CoA ligase
MAQFSGSCKTFASTRPIEVRVRSQDRLFTASANNERNMTPSDLANLDAAQENTVSVYEAALETALAHSHFNLAELVLDTRVEEEFAAGGKPEAMFVAVIDDDVALTYSEVQLRAKRVAALLHRLGLRAEERVAIALEDGCDFIATFFATLKLGGVVLMLNPELPPETARDLLSYSNTRWLVTTRTCTKNWDLESHAQENLTPILVDDEGWPAGIPSAPTIWPKAQTHRDDQAIWLLSGGTTGRPKIVMQTHASFANTTLHYGLRTLDLKPGDRTISVPKLFFGYATGSNLLFPFAAGATAIFYKGRPRAPVLAELIARHQATHLIGVPTMLNKLVALDEESPIDLRSLRMVTSAGEALPQAIFDHFRRRFNLEILDGLGTAEMWHVFLSNRPGSVKPGTLGTAVPGFEVRVCDDEGRELGPGETGWLWVRGGSRALGYWRNMESTARTFRGEWVVTGDMIVARDDGAYVYCGRGDDMLKVSGRWLAPAELESAIARIEGVEECVVVGAPDEVGLIKAFAFVRVLAASNAGANSIHERCRAMFEHFKVPKAVFVLPDFPRTHLGKADRRALRDRVAELRHQNS